MVLSVPTSFSRSQSKEAAGPNSERMFLGLDLRYFVGTECDKSRGKVVPLNIKPLWLPDVGSPGLDKVLINWMCISICVFVTEDVRPYVSSWF